MFAALWQGWFNLICLAFLPAWSFAQGSSTGYIVHSCKWDMLPTDYGYADLALDRRRGFDGREFLSGEWACAVYYQGGTLPALPRWLTPMFFYPDWPTAGPHFGVEKAFNIADPFNPTNVYGFNIYQSTITNTDLRISMKYEMLDLGTNPTARLAQGLMAASAGGAGSSLSSGRYVFQQTYTIFNRSASTLNNIKFYKFLHALESGWGVYDNRAYGGGLPAYHYSITQQGRPYGFKSTTGETVRHTDTLSVVFDTAPSGVELGLYGRKDVDNHVVGKPSVGVHLSVEANSLNGTDYFNPGSTGWVSGAVSFNLGSLSPGQSVSLKALLAIKTTYTVEYPPLNLVNRGLKVSGNNFLIDFQETTQNPVVGFALLKSTTLSTPTKNWEQVPIPYFKDIPLLGWNRFQAPYNPADKQLFFLIRPVIIND